jgi:hypothetical protein
MKERVKLIQISQIKEQAINEYKQLKANGTPTKISEVVDLIEKLEKIIGISK